MEFTFDLSQTPVIGRRNTGESALSRPESFASRPKDPFSALSQSDQAAKEARAAASAAKDDKVHSTRTVSL